MLPMTFLKTCSFERVVVDESTMEDRHNVSYFKTLAIVTPLQSNKMHANSEIAHDSLGPNLCCILAAAAGRPIKNSNEHLGAICYHEFDQKQILTILRTLRTYAPLSNM